MLLTSLFQNLREHAIASKTLEFAEEVTPFVLLQDLRHLEFDEAGQQLKRLLEKGYTDGIDGLENVRVEDGKIKGVFLDKVTSGLTKRYEFTIDEDGVSYKLLNPNALENADFSELEFARTKLAGNTKKEKNCPKGTKCRYSCISKLKECKYKTSESEKKEVSEIKQKLSGKKSASTIDDRPSTEDNKKKADNTSSSATKKLSKKNMATKVTLTPQAEKVFNLHLEALRGSSNAGFNKFGVAAEVSGIDGDKALKNLLNSSELKQAILDRYKKLVPSEEEAEKLANLHIDSLTKPDSKFASRLGVALANKDLDAIDVYGEFKKSPEFEAMLKKEYSKL